MLLSLKLGNLASGSLASDFLLPFLVVFVLGPSMLNAGLVHMKPISWKHEDGQMF